MDQGEHRSKRQRVNDGGSPPAVVPELSLDAVSPPSPDTPIVYENDGCTPEPISISDNSSLSDDASTRARPLVRPLRAAWACEMCSLSNVDADACAACETPRTFTASRLRVLSWNIAECVASASAPLSWKGGARSRFAPRQCKQAAAAIKETIVDRDPDVICLQECPGEAWAASAFGDTTGYIAVGSARSHCGVVVVLVKKTPGPCRDAGARGRSVGGGAAGTSWQD